MATEFAVDLVFRAPRSNAALDQLTKQMRALDRASQSIGGQDPLGGIAQSAAAARSPVAALGASFSGVAAAVGAAGAAFAALGLGLIAKQMIETAGAAQQLQAAFTSLTGSAAAAEKLRDSLFRLSKTTPFENEDILQAARGFLAVGVEADKVEGTINRVGALAANAGQDLGRVALIYSQVYAKGRLQGEENLQLLEAGIDIQQELAQVTGLSGAALQDAMSKGKIGIKEFNAALLLATGDMAILDAAAKSVSVQWQNLGDNAGQVFGGVSKALAPALGALPNVLNQAFDKLFPDLGVLDKTFAPLLKEAEKFNKLLTDNQEAVDAIATAFESLLNMAIKPAVEGLKQMNKWLDENPDGLVDAVLEIELGFRRLFFAVQGTAQLLTGPFLTSFKLLGKVAQGDFKGFIEDLKNTPQELLTNAANSVGTIGKAFTAQKLTPKAFTAPDVGGRADELSNKDKGGADDAARLDTIKKIKDLEIDAAKEVRDLNLDYIEEMGEARKNILKEIKGLEKDLLDQQRQVTRDIEDIDASIALQDKLAGVSGTSEQKAFQKARLEEEATFKQNERDRQRSFEDKQRERATKLEEFKIKTAETIGDINKKYLDNYGKIQEKYAENVAKIIQTGATNAGRILEAAATNAANTLAAANAGGGGEGSATGSGYWARLAELESTSGKNWKNPSSGAEGYFQLIPKTKTWLESIGKGSLATRMLSRDFDTAAKAAKEFAILMRPAGKKLMEEGDVKGLDRLYNRIWTSLPGGAEAATGARLAAANAKLTPGGGGTGAGVSIPGLRAGLTKQELIEVFRAVGYVRTDSPTSVHKTKNHYLNALDMALPMSPANMAKMQRAGEDLQRLGYGNVLHPGNDPGHRDHVHTPTPGGRTLSGASSGGGMGTPAARVEPKLIPLPKPLPLQKGPDLTAVLAPYQALLSKLNEDEKELLSKGSAEEIKKLFVARKEAIEATVDGFDDQIAKNDILLEQDQTRLGYIKDGINPALADQFATLDSEFALAEKRLQAEADYYEAQLQRTDLTKAELDYNLAILDVIKQQQGALPQRKATLRDQAVQKDQASKDPQNRLIEAAGKAKEDLDELLNPATQIISAANNIGDAFGQAFQDVATGSKSAKDALSDLFTSIGASFIKMAADIAAQQITLSLIKLFISSASGAGGGSLFGGGPTGAATNAGVLGSNVGAGFGGPSYAGGGYTGDGARSGGIDGQGGFPAILHPQETVVDHATNKLKPSSEYEAQGAAPEITYSGAVLRFNEQDYVSRNDIPKIVKASVAATGREMRSSVPFRRRAGM